MSERVVKIANRLYEARDSARLILGEKYHERIQEDQKLIRAVMAAHSCEALAATMAIVTELQKNDYSRKNAFNQITVLSAYVEMIEPSEEPTPCQT
jgi:hypothetical protein